MMQVSCNRCGNTAELLLMKCEKSAYNVSLPEGWIEYPEHRQLCQACDEDFRLQFLQRKSRLNPLGQRLLDASAAILSSSDTEAICTAPFVDARRALELAVRDVKAVIL